MSNVLIKTVIYTNPFSVLGWVESFSTHPFYARLALAVHFDMAESAAVSPKETEEALGLPGGTVRPRLQELVASRIVIKTGGKYAVDSTTLHRAANELESVLQ